ncbi:Six-hairpin glycosidase [Exidia glandulosa HHB12029]|uniref:Six-hairpin glycosidase n=1 Tax=Exidia glandulosa HHB12029 TaxID=1314781 RepID=A0A165I2P0_EXIGL|nr:Six-hairpin glycosidase [Exidia glandulosa HHB12029]
MHVLARPCTTTTKMFAVSALALVVPFLSVASAAPAPAISVGASASASASVGHPEFSRELIEKVRAGAISAPSHSWEWGTMAEALIELDTPELSVFDAQSVPASADLALPPVALQTVDDALATKPAGKKYFYNTGAVGDQASIGVTALIASITTGNETYLDASAQQLDFLLNDAPHDGIVISHRNETFQAWADFISMAPPFIAYYGALNGDKSLLSNAYEQCKGYRTILQDEETNDTDLWRHILRGTWNDTGLWLTGNAWAAYGMLRVQQTIAKSAFADEFKSESADLLGWTNEILEAVWSRQRESGAMLNYMDKPEDDPTNFEDSAGTTLLAAAQYRLATITGSKHNIDAAARAMQRMIDLVDADGWIQGAVDPLAFDKPTADGKHSPEAQSFVLFLDTAARKYYETVGADDSEVGGGAGVSVSVDIPLTGPTTVDLGVGATATVGLPRRRVF